MATLLLNIRGIGMNIALCTSSTLQAESVQLPGGNQLFRYCFQCGKLEALACFDGLRR